MLKLIREHSSSWLIKSILWMVVAAFMGTIFYSWGVGEYTERQGTVAEVLNERISYDEYREALDNLYNMYNKAMKDKGIDDEIPRSQLKQVALNTVIQRRLLLNEAEKMGIEVSDKEVIAKIKNTPAFQKEGRFDKNYYLEFLKYTRISAKRFEKNERAGMLINKVETLMNNSVKASELELREAYEWKHEKINFDYLVISPDLFKGKEEITDEKISEYFKKEKERFRKPDQVKVEYLLADPASFEKDAKISEQSIENYYSDHKDEYMEDESFRASHILIKKLSTSIDAGDDEKKKKNAEEILKKQSDGAKEKVENILAELKKDGNFEELAKKHSEDKATAENGGDLGYFSRGTMIKEFENAVHSLNVGEVSDIVETNLGYHIIKVTDKKEAGIKPLSNVKSEIKGKLFKRKSKKLAKRSLLNILRNPNPVSEFDKQDLSGVLKRGATEFFSLQDQEIPSIGEYPQFKTEAFSLRENEISRLVETAKGYYLIKLQEKKVSHLPQLDEVKDEVKESFAQTERDKIAAREAHILHEELKNGASMDKLAERAGIKTSHTDLFDRDEAINKFSMSKSLIDTAFRLKEKESDVVQVYEKYYLVHMVERTGFDEERFIKEKADFLKSFLEEKQNKVMLAWLKNLRENANITINEQLL